MGQQSFAVVNLDGGLQLTDTHYTLQERLGTAKVLDNFESTIEGGYRRIEGYTRFGTLQPSGAADVILGVYPYADGVVVSASTGVYFSTDGNSWIQVNRDTYTAFTGTVQVTGGSLNTVTGSGTFFLTDYTLTDHIRVNGEIRKIASIVSNTELTVTLDFSGAVGAGEPHYKNGTNNLIGTILPRTGQGRTQFAWLEDDGEYGSIALCDTVGNANVGRFKITGSGGSRVYEYDDLTNASFAALEQARYCTVFQQRLIVADVYEQSLREPGTIAWSDRYQNLRFDGASAGTAQVDSPVVAIKPFKNRLIIFCRNSIYQLSNINDPNTLEIIPISYNAGCAASDSIQEIGGDLVFLSYDGLRVLSATDVFGDVQLGVISTSIDPYIKEIINNINGVTVSSCIIRYKSQYRMFYTDLAFSDDQQLGLIGTMKRNRQGAMEWQWSRVKGIPVACMNGSANPFLNVGTKEENIFHGGFDGYIYQHDTGSNFNGASIVAECELNEIDYGDAGLKKTLHFVKMFGRIEGTTDTINLSLKYDYNSSRTMQPTSTYPITLDGGLAKYGTALFGVDRYGGGTYFTDLINIEGSGYTNNFTLTSDGTGAPYKLDSFYVDVRMGAKH